MLGLSAVFLNTWAYTVSNRGMCIMSRRWLIREFNILVHFWCIGVPTYVDHFAVVVPSISMPNICSASLLVRTSCPSQFGHLPNRNEWKLLHYMQLIHVSSGSIHCISPASKVLILLRCKGNSFEGQTVAYRQEEDQSCFRVHLVFYGSFWLHRHLQHLLRFDGISTLPLEQGFMAVVNRAVEPGIIQTLSKLQY